MKKVKSPGGGGHNAKAHAHSMKTTKKHNHVNMDHVKIKRVKRNKKQATTKEKILAGLGVGGALMGGLSSVAPHQEQKEIMAKNTDEQNSTGSKVKSALKNILASKKPRPTKELTKPLKGTVKYTALTSTLTRSII